MSWSFQATGRPAALKRELARCVNNYQAGTASREEFDLARPSLEIIIDANVGENACLAMTANGSATRDGDGKILSGQMAVTATPIWMLKD